MKYDLIEGRINVICPYVTCKETFKMHVKGEAVIFSSPVLSNYFFFIYILIIHCSLTQISDIPIKEVQLKLKSIKGKNPILIYFHPEKFI